MANITIHRTMPRATSAGIIGFLGVVLPGIPIFYMCGQGIDAVALAIAVATTLPWLTLVIRGLRIRFEADDIGVTVANLWTTRRIVWADIARIHTGPAPFWWQTKQRNMLFRIERVNGRSAPAAGTIRPLRDFHQLAGDLEELRALADAHGVPLEAKPLEAAEVARIDRQMATMSAVTGVARVVNRL
jgi:hypothetical protein